MKNFADIQKETGLTDDQMIRWMVEAIGMNEVEASMFLALDKGEITGDVVEEPPVTTKERIIRVSIKHLPGQHNQKRHGWRYSRGGSYEQKLGSARVSMQRTPQAGERDVYRKRAGMPGLSEIGATKKPYIAPKKAAPKTTPSEPIDRQYNKARYDNPEDALKRISEIKSLPINSIGGNITSQPSIAGDIDLAVIVRAQGFDAKPEILSRSGITQAIKDGDIELFRGTSSTISNIHDFSTQFMDRNFYQGFGVYGNGTYTASSVSDTGGGFLTAKQYAADYSSYGSVMHMALRKEARVIDYSTAYNKANTIDNTYSVHNGDAGRWAALNGYDAIYVSDVGYYVILNRSAVKVQSSAYNINTGTWEKITNPT